MPSIMPFTTVRPALPRLTTTRITVSAPHRLPPQPRIVAMQPTFLSPMTALSGLAGTFTSARGRCVDALGPGLCPVPACVLRAGVRDVAAHSAAVQGCSSSR